MASQTNFAMIRALYPLAEVSAPTEEALAAATQDPTGYLRWVEGDKAFLHGLCVAGNADILAVVVAPESRRRGLAGALILDFLQWCELQGAEAVFLEVREDNLAAQALYQRHGFELCGRRAGYFQAPPGDALVMKRVF